MGIPQAASIEFVNGGHGIKNPLLNQKALPQNSLPVQSSSPIDSTSSDCSDQPQNLSSESNVTTATAAVVAAGNDK